MLCELIGGPEGGTEIPLLFILILAQIIIPYL